MLFGQIISLPFENTNHTYASLNRTKSIRMDEVPSKSNERSSSTVKNDNQNESENIDLLETAIVQNVETKVSEDKDRMAAAGTLVGDENLVTPPDKFKIVYLIMILHGIGTLMPWNMFINAKEYFENYKLGPGIPDADWYSENFLTCLIWASQLPSLIFSWTNVFFPCGRGSLKLRIIISLALEIFICMLTMILAWLQLSADLFFGLTILSIITMNTAGGFYQNSVFGVGSKLGYVGALVLGSNICGVFTSVTNLIILATGTEHLKAALFYFGTAMIIMLLCLISFIVLPELEFYRNLNLKKSSNGEGEGSGPFEGGQDHAAIKYSKCNMNKSVLKECSLQCYNLFMLYFVTLLIFPGVHANVKRLSNNFVIDDPRYFVEVTCFLTFNVSSLLGNLAADWVQWPKPKYLWIPVTLRLVFIPFFLLCNYHPQGVIRAMSTVLVGDWEYWIGGAFLGLTNGYHGAVAMMYCSRAVKSESAGTAGMFGAAFLVTGVFAGGSLSDTMAYFVGKSI